jgi:hemoglobin
MAYAREDGPAFLKAPPPESADGQERSMPDLKFVATVALSLESSQLIGKTPDGVRLELRVHGNVAGPLLNGSFPSLGAHMLIDETGVGTLNVRAPIVLNDGAVLEIEAIVRYDFGPDGYQEAADGDLPDSVVAGALRFITGHPRYLWVNRALCLGVGALYSKERRIVYDLFVISSKALPVDKALPPDNSTTYKSLGGAPLYERLGGQAGLTRIAGDFFHGLETNPQLARQNPRIAVANASADPVERDRRFAQVLGQLTGGPCDYTGRPIEQVHAPMALSGADWTLGGEELVRALNKNNVNRADQNELLALIEPLKSQIVQGRP